MSAPDYDLHLHSGWSYDTISELKDYFVRASEQGIRCIGMTDHNNWDASGEALEYADEYLDVRYVSGTELYVKTETLPDMWLHLLCFNIPFSLTEELKTVQRIYGQWNRSGGEALVNAFSAILSVDSYKACEMAKNCRISRTLDVQGITPASFPGIEAALQKEGIQGAQDLAGSIRQNMWDGIPPVPSASEIIPLLKESGVLTVLPHPHYLEGPNETDTLDALSKELQLEGIECAHPNVPDALSERLGKYCDEHSLFKTAGSDSHTPDGLGKHRGENGWLDEFLERITV